MYIVIIASILRKQDHHSYSIKKKKIKKPKKVEIKCEIKYV